MSRKAYTIPSVFNFFDQVQHGLEYVEPIEFVYMICLLNMFVSSILLVGIYTEKRITNILFDSIKILRKISERIIAHCDKNTHFNNELAGKVYDINGDIINLKDDIKQIQVELNNIKR